MPMFASLETGAAPALSNVTADVTGFFTGGSFTGFSTLLISVAGIVLGFWLIRFLLRLVKGVASAGK